MSSSASACAQRVGDPLDLARSPNRVAGRGWRMRKWSLSSTAMPIASARPRRLVEARLGVAPRLLAEVRQRDDRAGAAGEFILRLTIEDAQPLGSSTLRFGKIDRMRGLHGRDGVLVDELAQAVALEQHAEQVEGRDLALQHDAVDQEHGHRLAGSPHRRQEDLLEQGRLLLVHLVGEGLLDVGQIDRLRRA